MSTKNLVSLTSLRCSLITKAGDLGYILNVIRPILIGAKHLKFFHLNVEYHRIAHALVTLKTLIFYRNLLYRKREDESNLKTIIIHIDAFSERGEEKGDQFVMKKKQWRPSRRKQEEVEEQFRELKKDESHSSTTWHDIFDGITVKLILYRSSGQINEYASSYLQITAYFGQYISRKSEVYCQFQEQIHMSQFQHAMSPFTMDDLNEELLLITRGDAKETKFHKSYSVMVHIDEDNADPSMRSVYDQLYDLPEIMLQFARINAAKHHTIRMNIVITIALPESEKAPYVEEVMRIVENANNYNLLAVSDPARSGPDSELLNHNLREVDSIDCPMEKESENLTIPQLIAIDVTKDVVGGPTIISNMVIIDLG